MNPEITAKYWQWIYSNNESTNPLKTGVVNKTDDVIMLPCTGGGAACDRSVVLEGEDTNKNILVPVFAAVKFGVGNIEKDARRMSSTSKAEMSIDGKPQDYEYVETKDFQIKGWDAVSSGYWHLHKPLSKGKHIVKFGGSGRYDNFFTKVQYDIEVK